MRLEDKLVKIIASDMKTLSLQACSYQLRLWRLAPVGQVYQGSFERLEFLGKERLHVLLCFEVFAMYPASAGHNSQIPS